ARAIGGFRREGPDHSFRGWLWTITRNKIRDQQRRCAEEAQARGGSTAQQQLAELPAPTDESGDEAPGQPGTAGLYRRALDLIRSEFEERTWQAFWLGAVEGHPTAEVAAELGMSPGAVYIAKSRVLRRLREEFADLM